jgi:hypothetical protein
VLELPLDLLFGLIKTGFRVQGSGFRVFELPLDLLFGFKIQGLGFRV